MENNGSQPTTPQQQPASGPMPGHPQPGMMLAWDAAVQFQDQWAQYQNATERMAAQVQLLSRASEYTKQSYARLVQERDALRAQLQSAEGRLAEVQRVVEKYVAVEDPVVASDGFTYERSIMETYLEDCGASEVAATSQQTKESLTDTLVPNHSLKKLVELLKAIKPQPVPDPVAVLPTEDMPSAAAMEAAAVAAGQPGAAMAPTSDRLHPCVRVYGFCNYKESCAYAKYPYDACLSHLKGKCRFGAQCHELHVEFKGPYNGPRTNQGPRRT